jgi:hypothetical protein
LGFRKVWHSVSRTSLAWQDCAHDLVLGLVALRLEVEVVFQRVVTTLADGRQHNLHVKLAPALLFDAERRLLDD